MPKKRPQPLPEPQTASDAVLLALASLRKSIDQMSKAMSMLNTDDSVMQAYTRLTQTELNGAHQRMQFILQRIGSESA